MRLNSMKNCHIKNSNQVRLTLQKIITAVNTLIRVHLHQWRSIYEYLKRNRKASTKQLRKGGEIEKRRVEPICKRQDSTSQYQRLPADVESTWSPSNQMSAATWSTSTGPPNFYFSSLLTIYMFFPMFIAFAYHTIVTILIPIATYTITYIHKLL